MSELVTEKVNNNISRSNSKKHIDVNNIKTRLIRILYSDDYRSVYDTQNLSSLHLAVISGDIYLVQKYCNKNIVNVVKEPSNVSALHLAIEFIDNNIDTRLKIIEILIKNGADINLKDKHGESPLYKATRLKENETIVPYLLSNGAYILENNILNTNELLLKEWLNRNDIDIQYKNKVTNLLNEKLRNITF